MLLHSVAGLAGCPRTRCIHRRFQSRSDTAKRVPDLVSSRTVGPHASSVTSRRRPRSWVFLGQVSSESSH